MRARRPPRTPPSKARKVLLDGTFLHALRDPDDPLHAQAVAVYRVLIDRYADGHDVLWAMSPELDAVPTEFRRGALAPVSTLHVAGQHRRAAARVMATHNVSADVALAVVMMRREKIGTIVTAAPEYRSLDVTVLDLNEPLDAADEDSSVPPGYVPYDPDAGEVPAEAPADPR